jgi:hypothetical protein
VLRIATTKCTSYIGAYAEVIRRKEGGALERGVNCILEISLSLCTECALHVCCDGTRDPVAGFCGASMTLERERDIKRNAFRILRSLNNSDRDRCRGTRTRQKKILKKISGGGFFLRFRVPEGPGCCPTIVFSL